MSRNKVFQNVRNVRPGKSAFDLSYSKLFDCNMGELIPIMCDETIPGDYFTIGNQSVIRFQPLVAPILHEINQFVHYFFVPYRLLWNEDTNIEFNDTGSWEAFITGGEDGLNADSIPVWDPLAGETDPGTLWDYLGFPTSIADPAGVEPVDFPRRAYNLIYNEYYRDENLIAKVDLYNPDILKRCWEKDYFTSALLTQQKGTAPALPISGITNATWLAADFTTAAPGAAAGFATSADQTMHTSNAQALANAVDFFNNNEVDLSNATTFDIADLRLAFQIQKWMERNNRCGSRYTEFLKAHFNESPRDDRLRRPEYIGGSRTPVIISEVLQTSSTDLVSPQGNLAGHGISVSNAFCGKYRAQEFGLIMGIMSVMPKPTYQQGMPRQWLRKTKYDYPFPEFANLSEQAIINAEIYVTNANSATNLTTWGYQGRFDECRTKNNMVCNNMRTTLDYWHLSRQFSSVPALNDTFVECTPRTDIFAAPSEPGLIVSFANLIKAVRPLPYMAEPGLIDHN